MDSPWHPSLGNIYSLRCSLSLRRVRCASSHPGKKNQHRMRQTGMLELKNLGVSPRLLHFFGEITCERLSLSLLGLKVTTFAKISIPQPSAAGLGVGQAVVYCRCDRLCLCKLWFLPPLVFLAQQGSDAPVRWGSGAQKTEALAAATLTHNRGEIDSRVSARNPFIRGLPPAWMICLRMCAYQQNHPPPHFNLGTSVDMA